MAVTGEKDAAARWAGVVLREVPITRIRSYLDTFGDKGPVAIGDACGNGCGSGCGNNCIAALDRFGHAEIDHAQLAALATNKDALRGEIVNQLEQLAGQLRR